MESDSSVEATVAFNVRICDSAGTTITQTILAIQASDSSATPPEAVVTTMTNRSFQNSSEDYAIPYSSFTLNDNDRIVVEIGYLQDYEYDDEYCTFEWGNNSSTDLPEDRTTTAHYNPWIEFSDWT